MDGEPLNLYTYVGADPVNGIDPLGLFRLGQVIRGGFAIGAGVAFGAITAASTVPVLTGATIALGSLSIGLGVVNIVSGAFDLQENIPAGPFELYGFVIDRIAQPCLDPDVRSSAQRAGSFVDIVSRIPGGVLQVARRMDQAAKFALNNASRLGGLIHTTRLAPAGAFAAPLP